MIGPDRGRLEMRLWETWIDTRQSKRRAAPSHSCAIRVVKLGEGGAAVSHQTQLATREIERRLFAVGSDAHPGAVREPGPASPTRPWHARADHALVRLPGCGAQSRPHSFQALLVKPYALTQLLKVLRIAPTKLPREVPGRSQGADTNA